MHMQLQPLRGQTALVTGGNSGIGAAISVALGAAGARVVINYLGNAEQAERLVRKISEAGGQAMALQADVSQETQVRELFEQIHEHWNRIDILVANAGIQRDSSLEEMTLEQWNQVLAVNLTGQFLCAREAVRSFKQDGVDSNVSLAAGKIICMSSVHDIVPWAGHVNYAASKGGVLMLMKSLAQEVAGDRIRVNAISPGAIKTDINRPAWETPEAESELLRRIPYNRVGEPADIAQAAVWLASDASDYLTGTTLYVDGGMTLYPAFIEGG